jgi:hypothetical protein
LYFNSHHFIILPISTVGCGILDQIQTGSPRKASRINASKIQDKVIK